MVKLTQLADMYQRMCADNVYRVTFRYRNNRATLEVLFLADSAPGLLVIAARSAYPTTLTVRVDLATFVISTYLSHAQYYALLTALGVESNPDNPFHTNKFFQDLDAHVPPYRPSRCAATPHQVAALTGCDVEEADKVYFVGWVPHTPESGRHVTAANLAKTRAIIGSAAYEICRSRNVSSRWSPVPVGRSRTCPELLADLTTTTSGSPPGRGGPMPSRPNPS